MSEPPVRGNYLATDAYYLRPRLHQTYKKHVNNKLVLRIFNTQEFVLYLFVFLFKYPLVCLLLLIWSRLMRVYYFYTVYSEYIKLTCTYFMTKLHD